ncbi:hypothetical protein SEA_ZITCH_85 [Gordonia Phage Zitch]|uniref:Uncharacterized protein n=3 Tax=Zitchvirus TaxID=2948963 RepID=A0A976U9S9_9CAUD|nr:hypothetical protein J1774_gp85 [Gordonia Phage Zitch]QKY78530.1 hypothetical protein SEA_ZITCH_85 [Gordonia Phage Zitch]UTN91822.1 hypothetical protein SEA_SAMPSON_85 [Gordonia Phage Sampson]UVF61704.1 hypothetical protein SEA_APUNK_83 [Gordonia phage APunk]
MNELPDLPEGAIVIHRATALRYLDPEDGQQHLLTDIDDGNGDAPGSDVSTVIGDIRLLEMSALEQAEP